MLLVLLVAGVVSVAVVPTVPDNSYDVLLLQCILNVFEDGVVKPGTNVTVNRETGSCNYQIDLTTDHMEKCLALIDGCNNPCLGASLSVDERSPVGFKCSAILAENCDQRPSLSMAADVYEFDFASSLEHRCSAAVAKLGNPCLATCLRADSRAKNGYQCSGIQIGNCADQSNSFLSKALLFIHHIVGAESKVVEKLSKSAADGLNKE